MQPQNLTRQIKLNIKILPVNTQNIGFIFIKALILIQNKGISFLTSDLVISCRMLRLVTGI